MILFRKAPRAVIVLSFAGKQKIRILPTQGNKFDGVFFSELPYEQRRMVSDSSPKRVRQSQHGYSSPLVAHGHFGDTFASGCEMKTQSLEEPNRQACESEVSDRWAEKKMAALRGFKSFNMFQWFKTLKISGIDLNGLNQRLLSRLCAVSASALKIVAEDTFRVTKNTLRMRKNTSQEDNRY